MKIDVDIIFKFADKLLKFTWAHAIIILYNDLDRVTIWLSAIRSYGNY